jgi:hypothetical protein
MFGLRQMLKQVALWPCTGCHLLVPGRPFTPFYEASPRPPDFKDIANNPPNGAFVETFSGVFAGNPEGNENSEPGSTCQEIKDLVALIVTLRDKPCSRETKAKKSDRLPHPNLNSSALTDIAVIIPAGEPAVDTNQLRGR